MELILHNKKLLIFIFIPLVIFSIAWIFQKSDRIPKEAGFLSTPKVKLLPPDSVERTLSFPGKDTNSDRQTAKDLVFRTEGSSEIETPSVSTLGNGIYQDAPYHKKVKSGRKSPAPINGQEALDNSVPVKTTSTTRRIGVSNGEIVVLDKTSEGVYHGHVRIWQELTDVMQNALIKAGLVNDKGKILKK
jgi:hypothetical protein